MRELRNAITRAKGDSDGCTTRMAAAIKAPFQKFNESRVEYTQNEKRLLFHVSSDRASSSQTFTNLLIVYR